MSLKDSWRSHGRSTCYRLMTSDSGQDLIEYSLLAGLVALVAIGAVTVVGESVRTALWDPLSVPF